MYSLGVLKRLITKKYFSEYKLICSEGCNLNLMATSAKLVAKILFAVLLLALTSSCQF